MMANGETNQDQGHGEITTKCVPLVFLKETDLFMSRKPLKQEWLTHKELYTAIAINIDASHITGLQRVRGMWRVYHANRDDEVTLMAEGVPPKKGKTLQVLNTNPDRFDGENTTNIRIKKLPLSVEGGIISRTLTLTKIDVITCKREKLRVKGRLTNC